MVNGGSVKWGKRGVSKRGCTGDLEIGEISFWTIRKDQRDWLQGLEGEVKHSTPRGASQGKVRKTYSRKPTLPAKGEKWRSQHPLKENENSTARPPAKRNIESGVGVTARMRRKKTSEV